MKTTVRNNLVLAFPIRLWIALALSVSLLAGVPAVPAQAAGCVVTSALDDGSPGTLRAAVNDVSCDTITFDAGLAGATITLGSTLTLGHDVTIDGSALTPQLSLSGGMVDYKTGVQVFSINAGITAQLKSLTITRGYNLTSQKGGGIYNAGSLTVTDSTLSDNNAAGSDYYWVKGNDSVSTPLSAFGGGIYNDGVLALTNSILSGNKSISHVQSYGGGIYNAGVLSVTGGTISGNTIGDEFCGIGFGGGIYNANKMTVTGSTISANGFGCPGETNNSGGGIYNAGTLTLTNSTLSGNSVEGLAYGGGIFNSGTLQVAASTFNGNEVDGGGGAISNTGVSIVTNSTFFNGFAWASGGIANAGVLTLTNSTFAGNFSYAHAGTGNDIGNGGSMYFANNILGSEWYAPNYPDCVNRGVILSNINNLVIDGSCAKGGIGFVKGDPLLGPLADNGGPTQTLALLPGSPAIDAGDDHTCAAAPASNLDQRGISRPQGPRCDIGAYEVVQTPVEHAANGGFDTYAGASKIPGGWIARSFTRFDGKSTGVKKAGPASVLMTGQGPVSKTLTQTLALAGAAGHPYRFSFWIRGSGIPPAGTCQAQVLFYSGTRLVMTKTVNCPIGTYAFTKKTFNFTATSAYTRAVIRFTYAKAGGWAWFDGASLIDWQ